MKIGIDASRYADNEATGVEMYSNYIIDGLLSEGKGHEFVTYSRERKDLKGNKVLPGRRFWTLRSLSAEMKSDPPDVLFVPSHVLPLRCPARSVIMIHDVAFRYFRSAYSFFQYWYLNWSTKSAVKRATKILVPSDATRDDLVKYFKCPKDKIEVVYHGFDKPKATNDRVFDESDVLKYFDIRKDSKYVLFVGRLETKKNLVRLIEAFAKFLKFHPDYRLILAGKRGVGFNKIIKVVGKLKLVDKVLMPGYITEDEKAGLYKHCAVFAFPSLYEGFGFPILEAFHYGAPVLTSHTSCLTEVAGEAAYYVDPHDVDEMEKGLSELVKDSEKLVKLGHEQVKKFTWDSSVKQTLKVLTNGQ